ncbi:MAG: alpha/beta fold hydrolase [Methylococcaceae bacterium]|nr:alpha/beta fold hydrolase [Methylococcaceae bacterium]
MAGVTLHFEEQGDSARPALIIVHGFFASARNWRYIATQLSRQYHVFTLDMRNHGLSPHVEPMDYPTMAADLHDFIVQRGFISVSILGHSMGGKVALWFAVHYPELLHKLIVVDISPASYTHNFDVMITALIALPLHDLSNRKQADDWLSQTIAAPDFRQFLLQNLILSDGQYRWRIDLGVFKRAAPAIVGFPDTHRLKPFPDALLVLAGEQSDFVQVDTFKSLFPRATFQTIANAGHWLHVHAPERFLAAVCEYLEG